MTECEQYQEMIGALLDGELSQQERAALRAHVAVCPACRAMLEAFEAISGAMQEEIVQPPEDFTQKVMERVVAAERRAKQPRPRWQRALALAACLALVVIGVTPWLPRASSVKAPDVPQTAIFAAPETADAAPAAAPEPAEPEAPADGVRVQQHALDSSEQQYAPDGGTQQTQVENDGVFAASRSVENDAALVYGADGTQVCTLSDVAAVEALHALLEPAAKNGVTSAAESGGAAERTAPDYTVVLDGETVSIWAQGDTLQYTVGDGALLTAAGTAEQLQALLEQNGAE